MPLQSMRQTVGVDEARAFVATTEKLEAMLSLGRGWDGEGSKPPSRAAIASALRLIKDRQMMASRFQPEAETDGSISLHFISGPEADGDPARIHINKDGKPAILANGVAANDDDDRYRGIKAKEFRKTLDGMISPRKGRYGVNKIEIDGIVFDSPAEGRRYGILKSEEKLGKIQNLRFQVDYPYKENGIHCFVYRSDFNYTIVETGEEVVEDVKGFRTDVYRLKKKLIEARYGIVISEWPLSKKEIARRKRLAEKAILQAEKDRRRQLREEQARLRREEKEKKAAARAARKTPGETPA